MRTTLTITSTKYSMSSSTLKTWKKIWLRFRSSTQKSTEELIEMRASPLVWVSLAVLASSLAWATAFTLCGTGTRLNLGLGCSNPSIWWSALSTLWSLSQTGPTPACMTCFTSATCRKLPTNKILILKWRPHCRSTLKIWKANWACSTKSILKL